MFLNAIPSSRQIHSPFQAAATEPPPEELAVPRDQVELQEPTAVRTAWSSVLRGSTIAALAFAGIAAFSSPAHALAMDTRMVAVTHQAAPSKLHATAPVHAKGDYIAHGINFSNLISDAEFENTGAVSQQEIQRYLTSQHSALTNLVVDGRHASRIVAEAARENHVNPVVILATLEKESGLVTYTGHTPPRYLQRSAMGYGYDDSGSTAGRQATFETQVREGAKLLRQLYDEGKSSGLPAHIKVNYGTRTIQVDNAATYALYRYTPHTTDIHLDEVGGGNYLFREHYLRMVSGLKQQHTLPATFKA